MEKTEIWINAEQFLSLIYCILHYLGSCSCTIAKQTCLSTAPGTPGIIILMSPFRTAGPGLIPTALISCYLDFLNIFFSCKGPDTLFTIFHLFFIIPGSRASFTFHPKWGDINNILFLVHGTLAQLIYFICGFSHWFNFKIHFFSLFRHYYH